MKTSTIDFRFNFITKRDISNARNVQSCKSKKKKKLCSKNIIGNMYKTKESMKSKVSNYDCYL